MLQLALCPRPCPPLPTHLVLPIGAAGFVQHRHPQPALLALADLHRCKRVAVQGAGRGQGLNGPQIVHPAAHESQVRQAGRSRHQDRAPAATAGMIGMAPGEHESMCMVCMPCLVHPPGSGAARLGTRAPLCNHQTGWLHTCGAAGNGAVKPGSRGRENVMHSAALGTFAKAQVRCLTGVQGVGRQRAHPLQASAATREMPALLCKLDMRASQAPPATDRQPTRGCGCRRKSLTCSQTRIPPWLYPFAHN